MTDQRFDELTKAFSRSTSRRSILKALAGTALGGVLTRADRRGASAATKRPACARLHEACSASKVCCAGAGTCVNGVCCKTTNARCINDSDCCDYSDEICRPAHPGDVLQVCLPPAALGQACANDFDCIGNLVCDPYTDTCLGDTGEPCVDDSECASGICDEYTGFCVADCLPSGTGCAEDADCCSGLCDFYTSTCAYV